MWLTLGGLGLVVVVFAVLIVGGSLRDQSIARDAARSGDLARSYMLAQDALSREDEVEDQFVTKPAPRLRARFEAAAHDFNTAMANLARSGELHDRVLARRASRVHRRSLLAMRAMFETSDAALAEEIGDRRLDPAHDALRELINGTGPRYAVAQLSAIDQMQRGERRELLAALVAVPLGATLYLMLIAMFVRQRRRLDRLARAEVERLDEAAHTDSLTGLWNRRALHRDLATRDGAPQVMAMLDVVGLKPVNDARGHLAGDALLQTVAAAVREEVRQGRGYRIGGDEFAIVLPGADEGAGHTVVDGVRARVAVRHPAGVRGGVACGEDAMRLLEDASDALVDARRAGGLRRAA